MGQPRVALSTGREGRLMALTEAGDANVLCDGGDPDSMTLALLWFGEGARTGTSVSSMSCERCGKRWSAKDMQPPRADELWLCPDCHPSFEAARRAQTSD